MRWITNHKDWWSSLTSTFIGSLLGIGITFAVTDYIQTQHQTRMVKKMVITTIQEMDSHQETTNSNIDFLFHVDSLFTAIENHHEDKTPLSKDSIELYYSTIGGMSFEFSGDYINNIFEAPLELMDIFDDLSFMNDIKTIHDWQIMEKNIYKNATIVMNEILEYNLQNKIKDKADLHERFIEYQYNYYKMKYNIGKFHSMTHGLKFLNENMTTPLLKQLKHNIIQSFSKLDTIGTNFKIDETFLGEKKR